MERHNEVTSPLHALKAVHVMYVKQQLTLLNALHAHFGPDVARIAAQASAEQFCQLYLAQASEQRTIDDLIRLLWEPLRQQGYEFTIQHTAQGVQMTCTACPLAKLYRQLGGAEWGYHLYCAADAMLTEHFNPRVGFRRTTTLMEGHACCDHLYYNKG